MTEAIHERGTDHHGMEIDGSPVSLRARWAAQIGTTIYDALPAPATHIPSSYSVERYHNSVTVGTRLGGLSETRKQGAFVSSVEIAAEFLDGQISGASVKFFRQHQGRPQLFLTTACIGSSHIEFLATMSKLRIDRQNDITTGLQTIGMRMGLPADAMLPAPHLRAEMEARRAMQQAMQQIDGRLAEPTPEPDAA